MRTTPLTGLSLRAHDHDNLIFDGGRGERLNITVLDHDLIRVQHWPEGMPRLDRTWMVAGAGGDVPREGRRRDDLSPFPLPGFSLEQMTDYVRLTTDRLRLDIPLGDFHLRWSTADGVEFAADLRRRAYEYDRAGQSIGHFMERRLTEHYYGLGERSGGLDKHGRRLRMLNLDAMGYNAETGDPLYKHWPFYITLVPEFNLAYGLFYDSLATSVFDLGAEISAFHGFYRYYQAEGGDLDYTLIFGPTIAQVVARFARLIGGMAVPPRWSLGYLGSTMTYTEAADASERLREFVALCAQHDIPCDLFHLSSGYSTGPDGTRYVFNWNRSKIPDPRALAADFRAAGIRLAANIKPWLLTSHPRYDEVKALKGFIQAADADVPEVGPFWSGGAFTSAPGSYIDFTAAAGYDWWRARVTDSLLDYGISSTWNDNNEFEVQDDEARCDGFGQPLPVGLARPVQTLLMTRASYEAQAAFQPDERPFLISRAGCPGIQRYAQTWTGDNVTSWHSLRYNIPMGLGLSLSGLFNFGHDVGGFYGPRPSPELFLRWVQCGVFHPRFTIHSFNTDGSVNEPWMYPEILPLIREWFQLRCRLIPYLYTLLFHAAQTGEPVIRPLVYSFQDDPRTHSESFTFLLGPHLLVAPVTEEGARTKTLYLPGRGQWCDFATGEWHTGGQTITAAAPLERIPLLVPAGGIIPLGPVMRHVGAQPDDLRQAYVFPHPDMGAGRFTLIEDDGLSRDYERGAISQVALSVEAAPDRLHLRAQVERSAYPLAYDAVDFILPPGETRPVYAPGAVEQVEGDGRRQVRVPLSY